MVFMEVCTSLFLFSAILDDITMTSAESGKLTIE